MKIWSIISTSVLRIISTKICQRFVDYKINQLDSDNKLNINNDDIVAVGMTYQFLMNIAGCDASGTFHSRR
ncbi:porin [Escherichia coli]|uniref:porin n=1 Tax=Escherichia coli TaxID=562 RepID=UPI0024DF0F19|nr:porin [Escherichia coli]